MCPDERTMFIHTSRRPRRGQPAAKLYDAGHASIMAGMRPWSRVSATMAVGLTLAGMLSSCGSSSLKKGPSDAGADVATGNGSGGASGHDGSAADLPAKTDGAGADTTSATDVLTDTSTNADRPVDMASPTDTRGDAAEGGGAADAKLDAGASDAFPFGSCNGQPNPDTVAPIDAGVPPTCSLTASVSSSLPCTTDCCVVCGIDLAGVKTCTCPLPGQPYSNCACLPPVNFPSGLTGGSCSPQGYSGAVPGTAPAGSISLEGVPCTRINNVCFTAESTPSSERGCICLRDGTMHCGPVNHWFTNDGSFGTLY